MKPYSFEIALAALACLLIAWPVDLVGQDTSATTKPIIRVLAGDPDQAGHSAVRITFPVGFRTDPHHHGVDLTARVRKGRLMMGWGTRFDTTQVVAFQPGSSTVIPAGKDHYDWFPEGAEVEYGSEGPWQTVLVDSAGKPKQAQ
jgi:mannose-6-phosphate isomerase-like protein (cupin superfamily)